MLQETPFLTISEMSVKFGVTLRALRFYEFRGLLSPLRQRSIRLYSSHEQIRLQMIQKGKQLGFSLAEIDSIMNSMTTSDAQKLSTLKATTQDITALMSVEQIMQQLDNLQKERCKVQDAIADLSKALERT